MLAYHKESPRIDIAVGPYPKCWAHHVIVAAPEGIDDELLGWIEESHQFSLAKHRGKGVGLNA